MAEAQKYEPMAGDHIGKCGFCGREVHASLKPMCGDCAGKEDPTTATLRADLAKAKERIRELSEDGATCCRATRGTCPHGNIR